MSARPAVRFPAASASASRSPALPEDPLVLVLDEATSTVNEATAARIIRAVDALFAGHTRIVISHRTAQIRPTVRAADGRLLPSAGRAPPT